MGEHDQQRLQSEVEGAGAGNCIGCGSGLPDELVAAGICMDCVLADDESAVEQPVAIAVNLPGVPGVPKSKQVAMATLNPALQSGLTGYLWNKATMQDLDPVALMGELEARAAGLASDGSLAQLEALLLSQAHTMDAVSNVLLRKAAQMPSAEAMEGYLRLGLKAQAQSRATVSALADLKRPRQTAFVRQANIAHGPQQVNNGGAYANDEGRTPDGGQGSVDPSETGAPSGALSGVAALAEKRAALYGML